MIVFKDNNGLDRFMDEDGATVRVTAVFAEPSKYPCPRCNMHLNAEVETTSGMFLYCRDCGVYYPEFGNWGYRNGR